VRHKDFAASRKTLRSRLRKQCFNAVGIDYKKRFFSFFRRFLSLFIARKEKEIDIGGLHILRSEKTLLLLRGF